MYEYLCGTITMVFFFWCSYLTVGLYTNNADDRPYRSSTPIFALLEIVVAAKKKEALSQKYELDP